MFRRRLLQPESSSTASRLLESETACHAQARLYRAGRQDFIVQTAVLSGPWKNVEHFESPFSAKQFAEHRLLSGRADSV